MEMVQHMYIGDFIGSPCLQDCSPFGNDTTNSVRSTFVTGGQVHINGDFLKVKDLSLTVIIGDQICSNVKFNDTDFKVLECIIGPGKGVKNYKISSGSLSFSRAHFFEYQFYKCPLDCPTPNGTCDGNTGNCKCNNQHFGISCEFSQCPLDCSTPNGTCDINTGICSCNNEHFGNCCQIIQCPLDCSTPNGTCDIKTGICTCHNEHFGNGCDFSQCPLDCSTPNGTCDSNTGICSSPLEKKSSSEILNYFQNFSQQIKQAKSILVVGGGGAVACELVSEIVEKYPVKDSELVKKITIVHSGSKLVSPKMNEKYTNVVSKTMEKRNVQVILNDRITIPDEIKTNLLNQTSPNIQLLSQNHTAEKGLSIQADLIIWTVGIKTNSESYQSNFSNVINDCQVQGYDNVFAIGDCTDFDEFKTAYNAAYHGTIASKAIDALSKGKRNDKLAKHKLSGPILSLSLGPQDGITQISPTMCLGSFPTIIQNL
ncbi:hypothetical protein ACTFIZ_001360 [Dictyostelium cf. discoideum]